MGKVSRLAAVASALMLGLTVPAHASATACVPPDVDISQYIVNGEVDLEAYLAAVAAANAICNGATTEDGTAITPDSSEPVSETIGAEGGTITATASNGATFSFTVPAGSLPAGVTITIRPVTVTVGGVTSVVGIQFSPEGLVFDPPAQLSISIPGGVPSNLHMYRYSGVGSNITEIDYSTSGSSVTVSIPHFSGVFGTVGAVNGSGGGVLPTTGSDSMQLLPFGIVFAGVGVAAVTTARRRRRPAAA